MVCHVKLNSRPANLQIKNRRNFSEVTVAHAVVTSSFMRFPQASRSAISNSHPHVEYPVKLNSMQYKEQ